MAQTGPNFTAKRSKMSRLIAAQKIAIIFMMSLVLGFSGCESKKGSSQEPVVTKQIGSSAKKIPSGKNKLTPAKAKTAPAPAPAAGTVKVAAQKRMPYNPVGKVDPFAPLYKDEQEKAPEKVVVRQKGPERPRTPLEKLDLGQLKLTAIVATPNMRRALVEETSGKGYVIELGTKIGLERGAVVEIKQDRIIIEHKTEDDFGKAASKKRELKLQKPPGD